MLLFFNDILIYNSSLEEHAKYLQMVLRTIREHSLFAKLNKSAFDISKVECLGRYILAKGVEINPKKSRSRKQMATTSVSQGSEELFGAHRVL